MTSHSAYAHIRATTWMFFDQMFHKPASGFPIEDLDPAWWGLKKVPSNSLGQVGFLIGQETFKAYLPNR